MSPEMSLEFYRISQMGIATFYYITAALAVVAVFIRVVYGWFRDYDNVQRFTGDMAMTHLPYIYSCFNRIADRLDVKLEPKPDIGFSRHNPS